MTLTLPEGDFKAYLFDCDGPIAHRSDRPTLAAIPRGEGEDTVV